MGAVVAFGAAGTASAAPLLFLPESHKFPYHLTGLGGETIVNILGNSSTVTAPDVHVLVQFLSQTLYDVTQTFLGVKLNALGGGTCTNTATAGVITTGLLLGHLGLADHEGKERPAGLILVPHFSFTCSDSIVGEQKFLITGGLIGEITSPAVNGAASEMLLLLSQQHGGLQLLRSILFGTELVTTDQKISLNGGAFTLFGQEGEATLHALVGEGPFLLISP
jgi:hypothetical protein